MGMDNNDNTINNEDVGPNKVIKIIAGLYFVIKNCNLHLYLTRNDD